MLSLFIVEGPSSVLLGYYVTRSSDISKESTKMLSRYNKKVSERKSGRILHNFSELAAKLKLFLLVRKTFEINFP